MGSLLLSVYQRKVVMAAAVCVDSSVCVCASVCGFNGKTQYLSARVYSNVLMMADLSKTLIIPPILTLYCCWGDVGKMDSGKNKD